MKLLMVLPGLPYPLDRDEKLRAYRQMCYLHKQHEVYLVCLCSEPVAPAHVAAVKEHCHGVIIVQHSRLRKLLNSLAVLYSKLPFLVHYFYNPDLKKCIRKLVAEKEIDLIFVQQVKLTLNIPFNLPCAYFLDYIYNLSYAYQKQLTATKTWHRRFMKEEARRLKNYETSIANSFQGYAILSKSDSLKFSPELQPHMLVIPNGVSERFLNYSSPIAVFVKKYDLLFAGNLGYKPNAEACLFLVQKVLPLLSDEFPSLKICLAGATPTAAVQALENHRAVTVTGFVPDLREYMATARLYVAPIFTGPGLPNKLLEAMAMGLPVLTTPEVNSVLGALNGHDLIECTEPEDFAQYIKYMLKNEQEASRFGDAGRTFVQKHFDWEASNQRLELSLSRLVQK